MPAPRPYGRGPYGVGPYSRYRGTIYECGGHSSIAFDARLRGAQRIRLAEALTSISFDALADLELTWALPAPCDGGIWMPAAGCQDGLWAPETVGGAGTWGSPTTPSGGSWGPLAGCSDGAWTPAGLV